MDQKKSEQNSLVQSDTEKAVSDARVLREVANDLRQLVDNLLDTMDSSDIDIHKGQRIK